MLHITHTQCKYLLLCFRCIVICSLTLNWQWVFWTYASHFALLHPLHLRVSTKVGIRKRSWSQTREI